MRIPKNLQDWLLDRLWKLCPLAFQVCPACGVKSEQAVSDSIHELFSGSRCGLGVANREPGSFTPLVLILCKHCGHQQFYNAIALGLIDSAGKLTQRPPEPT